MVLLLAAAALPALAEMTAETILKKVDEQMLTKTAYSEATMIIHNSDTADRQLKFKSYAKGRSLSILEFTYPAREKGTKFLRRGKTMWLYFPRADRVRQIKGHMLRQGMMGSDFSYEDASEVESIYVNYNAALLPEEKHDGRDAYVLELTAKNKKVTYQKRRIWVDKKWLVPLKEELFAKSGLLLKELQFSDIKKISGRYYPTRWKMINKLTGESSTEMMLTLIKIDIPVAERIFSLANLKRR